MSSSQKLFLPDLVSSCPFKWSVHPEYERAREESAAWIDRFKVFTDRKRVIFNMWNFELLVALTHPYAGYEEFRTCCDCNNMLFVFDELSDEVDGDETRKLGDILLGALGGKSAPGSVLSRIGEEFRARLIEKAALKCQERFLATCCSYIIAVSREAELRKNGEVLQLGSYVELRRENSGLRPFFALIEYVHGFELPDDVFNDPEFMRLYWLGADAICLSNDLYSFSMERAKGLEGNNFLTVVMREKGLNVQEAADFTGKEIMDYVDRFVEGQKKLPSFGKEVDENVQKYLFSIAQWYAGNLIWSFETPRYFGLELEEVKKSLVVNVKEQGYDVDTELIENKLRPGNKF